MFDFVVTVAVHSVTSVNWNVRDFDCLPNRHWRVMMVALAVIQNLFVHIYQIEVISENGQHKINKIKCFPTILTREEL